MIIMLTWNKNLTFLYIRIVLEEKLRFYFKLVMNCHQATESTIIYITIMFIYSVETK